VVSDGRKIPEITTLKCRYKQLAKYRKIIFWIDDKQVYYNIMFSYAGTWKWFITCVTPPLAWKRRAVKMKFLKTLNRSES